MMSITKKELRNLMIKKRISMTGDEVKKNSDAILCNLQKCSEFMEADIILCYASYGKEVGTDGIFDFCLSHNKSIAFPRVDGSDMDFYYVKLKEELIPGFKGIREPVTSLRVNRRDMVRSVMIVPGTSFDMKLNRNGYGGGYYDRYIEKFPPGCVIGLAYEFQILPAIPHEEFDKKVDYIVSEVKIYGK